MSQTIHQLRGLVTADIGDFVKGLGRAISETQKFANQWKTTSKKVRDVSQDVGKGIQSYQNSLSGSLEKTSSSVTKAIDVVESQMSRHSRAVGQAIATTNRFVKNWQSASKRMATSRATGRSPAAVPASPGAATGGTQTQGKPAKDLSASMVASLPAVKQYTIALAGVSRMLQAVAISSRQAATGTVVFSATGSRAVVSLIRALSGVGTMSTHVNNALTRTTNTVSGLTTSVVGLSNATSRQITLQQRLASVTQSMAGGVMSSWSRAVSSIDSATTRIGLALAGIGGFAVKTGIGFNALMQRSEVAFTTMLGSAQKARSFLADLQKFAKETPFEIRGLVEQSQRMLAFGFTAEEIIPTLRAVGDAVAALGGTEEVLQRVILAIGQIKAKGAVQAEEFRQLAEAGIPAWDILAEKLGVDIPTAMKMVEDRAVSARVAIDALTEGMNARFGGTMELQAQRFSGLLSRLKESIEVGAGRMFEPLFVELNRILQSLNEWADSSGFVIFIENARSKVQELIQAFWEVYPAIKQAAEIAWEYVRAISQFLIDHPRILAALIALKVAGFMGVNRAVLDSVVAIASLVARLAASAIAYAANTAAVAANTAAVTANAAATGTAGAAVKGFAASLMGVPGLFVAAAAAAWAFKEDLSAVTSAMSDFIAGGTYASDANRAWYALLDKIGADAMKQAKIVRDATSLMIASLSTFESKSMAVWAAGGQLGEARKRLEELQKQLSQIRSRDDMTPQMEEYAKALEIQVKAQEEAIERLAESYRSAKEAAKSFADEQRKALDSETDPVKRTQMEIQQKEDQFEAIKSDLQSGRIKEGSDAEADARKILGDLGRDLDRLRAQARADAEEKSRFDYVEQDRQANAAIAGAQAEKLERDAPGTGKMAEFLELNPTADQFKQFLETLPNADPAAIATIVAEFERLTELGPMSAEAMQGFAANAVLHLDAVKREQEAEAARALAVEQALPQIHEFTNSLGALQAQGLLTETQVQYFTDQTEALREALANGDITTEEFQAAMGRLSAATQDATQATREAAEAAKAKAEAERREALIRGDFKGAGMSMKDAMQDRIAQFRMQQWNAMVDKQMQAWMRANGYIEQASEGLQKLGNGANRVSSYFQRMEESRMGGTMADGSQAAQAAQAIFGFLNSPQGVMSTIQNQLILLHQAMTLSNLSSQRRQEILQQIAALEQQAVDLMQAPPPFTLTSAEELFKDPGLQDGTDDSGGGGKTYTGNRGPTINMNFNSLRTPDPATARMMVDTVNTELQRRGYGR